VSAREILKFEAITEADERPGFGLQLIRISVVVGGRRAQQVNVTCESEVGLTRDMLVNALIDLAATLKDLGE
jgi:hypothetical protein